MKGIQDVSRALTGQCSSFVFFVAGSGSTEGSSGGGRDVEAAPRTLRLSQPLVRPHLVLGLSWVSVPGSCITEPGTRHHHAPGYYCLVLRADAPGGGGLRRIE